MQLIDFGKDLFLIFFGAVLTGLILFGVFNEHTTPNSALVESGRCEFRYSSHTGKSELVWKDTGAPVGGETLK